MRRSRATPPAVSRTTGACWLCWLCWLMPAVCCLSSLFDGAFGLFAFAAGCCLSSSDGCDANDSTARPAGKGTDGRWVVAGQKAPACNNCANRGLGSNCLWDDELGAFHGAEGEEQEEAGRVR